ncbi:MAG: hypothetical protein COB12_05910 [Flavobacterium sp.]|nr:MAG: hypothetical protein COB12_05910 [Flavobacterium sp.]
MTKVKKQYDIFSYEDLQRERQKLKLIIIEQEVSLKENPIVKITKSFNNSSSVSSSVKEVFSGLNFQSGEALISSLLLSSKKTRKYYLAYIVAKEMVPFTIQKVKELVESRKAIDNND